jgi:hypothetical protein
VDAQTKSYGGDISLGALRNAMIDPRAHRYDCSGSPVLNVLDQSETVVERACGGLSPWRKTNSPPVLEPPQPSPLARTGSLLLFRLAKCLPLTGVLISVQVC